MRRSTTMTLAALVAASFAAACGELPAPTGPRLRPDASGVRAPLLVKGGVKRNGQSSLVTCTAPAEERRGTFIVGPEGGTVTFGGARLQLPAGAVPVATVFEIVLPASAVVEVDVHAVGVPHYVFERPVTLTVSYERCGADPIPLDAVAEGVYIAHEPYTVLENMGGTLDRTARTVTFTTGHLSGYAVAY
jgi:hypothetical protein